MEDRGIRRDYTHLMKASASVEDHENFHDFTPLMDAAQKGNYFLVRHLLEIGSNVNDQTKTGHTALTYASWNGHTHIANLLMQFGAARDNSTMLLPQAQESAASALMLLPQHQQQQTTQPKNKEQQQQRQYVPYHYQTSTQPQHQQQQTTQPKNKEQQQHPQYVPYPKQTSTQPQQQQQQQQSTQPKNKEQQQQQQHISPQYVPHLEPTSTQQYVHYGQYVPQPQQTSTQPQHQQQQQTTQPKNKEQQQQQQQHFQTKRIEQNESPHIPLKDTSVGAQIQINTMQDLQTLEDIISRRCEKAYCEGYRQGYMQALTEKRLKY